MKILTKLLILLAIFGSALSSCEKDDETNDSPIVVTSCIDDDYSGNYNGTGTLNNIPNTNMLVKLTKISCTSCKIESDSIIETLVSLEQSDAGGYKGKDSNGNDASISANGNSIDISTDKITFSGGKQ